ncbi:MULTISPECIES: hypothetical protein [unclassified Lentilitoribacter]|uniref:hypothetical protein n=1 Tax=unclassified Lentilitoribacter TaxID=2647570 RepID=UPI0013A6EF82|nr:hypothetical protein [Lentilitoribacter sp. Alg239-R112]
MSKEHNKDSLKQKVEINLREALLAAGLLEADMLVYLIEMALLEADAPKEAKLSVV